MLDRNRSYPATDVDNKSADLSESNHSSRKFTTLQALSLMALGGLSSGLGVFQAVKSAEAQALERLSELTAKVEVLDDSRNGLQEELSAALAQYAEHGQNLEEVNQLLSQLRDGLGKSETRILELEEVTIPSQLRDLAEQFEKELSSHEHELAVALETVRENSRDIDQIEQDFPRPPSNNELWKRVMSPTVRLHGERVVGSGVLLRSEKQADGAYETHALSAWHVVAGIKSEWKDQNAPEPIQVQMYTRDGRSITLHAEIVSFDQKIDAVLLKIKSNEPLSTGVTLPTREEAKENRQTFQPVYASGCPLGVDPIPAKGEVTSPHHKLGDSEYILINAPTYVGNSGGPIIDGEDFRLTGIYTKVYTSGGDFQRIIVPHMGLVIPMDQIYDWFERDGHGALVPKAMIDSGQLAQVAPSGK